MNAFYLRFKNMLSDESGQDLIEYALIASLIGLAAVTAMGNIASAIGTLFGKIVDALNGTTPST